MDDKTSGACLTAPGSHASHEAPTGLRPSGFDPSRYFVGQKLYVAASQRYFRSGDVVVAKVGRKWVSLVWPGLHSSAGRVAIGSRSLDGDGYASPGKLYLSEAEYTESRRLDAIWVAIRKSVDRVWNRPDHLTEETMTEIARLLRDTDGSPQGTGPQGLDGAAATAATAGAEGIAHPSSEQSS